LIHDDIVLTAAHYALKLGTAIFSNSESAIVHTYAPHPGYNPKNLVAFDIMILKLTRSFKDITPVAINTDRKLPVQGAEDTVIGRGISYEGGGPSDVLRLAKVKIMKIDSRNIGEPVVNDDFIICVNGINQGSCQGDSGGPAIIAGNTAADDVQVGIGSFGFSECGSGLPTVRIRVRAFTDWIESQICYLSANRPASCPALDITPGPPKNDLNPSFCFSAETTVQIKNKVTISMKDLKLGDKVLAAAGKYEQVYSFGHRHESVSAEFLQLLPSTLEISRDHMLLVRGRYVPASAVQVGDKLESASGDVITVEAINTVVRTGVYAPFTSSRTIVVSNIYIAFQDSGRLFVGGWETPFMYQWIAHMSHSPHRILSRLGLSGAKEYTFDGMSTWIAGPYEVSQWFIVQNWAVMTVVLVSAMSLGMLSMVLESVCQNNFR
jgi:hypothetical protein